MHLGHRDGNCHGVGALPRHLGRALSVPAGWPGCLHSMAGLDEQAQEYGSAGRAGARESVGLGVGEALFTRHTAMLGQENEIYGSDVWNPPQ